MKYLEKDTSQSKFSNHKTHSHWLGIEQLWDIYNRSWSRNWYITIIFVILLIPTHVPVITNTTTTTLFRSANTNVRMWSCTAANVRCCHSTEGNTATICYLTYHSFLTTISSNKANTTAAQIMTPQCGAHSTRLQWHIVLLSATSIRAITNSNELCPVNSALSTIKH